MESIQHLCECGCGLPTPIATRTQKDRGHVKGQPIRFIRFHYAKIQVHPPLRLTERICPMCGKVFMRRPIEPGNYCSPACRIEGQRNTVHKRLYHRIDKSGGPDACHPWTGAKDQDGYGHMSVNNKQKRIPRLIYEQAHGPLEKGILVCHTCDNPSCCNLAHLFAGTNADNVADMMQKGRYRHPSIDHPGFEKRGEEHHNARLTEDKVRLIRTLRADGWAYTAIAEEVGVSKGAVNHIINGRAWKHVA